jgi:hypothetical protein
MNPTLGWALVAAALLSGGLVWGWPGVALALSVTLFWLLLQFSRSLRVLRLAGQAPMGRIDSAVMMGARLGTGMTMMQVLPLARSLGEVVGDPQAETWCWRDAGGDRVELRFVRGRLVQWALTRAEAPGDTPDPPGPDRPRNDRA